MLAQITQNPANPTPTLNDGGWVYNAAILLAALGILVLLLIVFGYMRFAPRFQTEEGERRSVKAPRLGPGKEVRRPVNVVGAPVIAQPPVVATVGAPAVAAVAAPAPAAPAPAPAAAPAAAPVPQAAPAAAAPAPAAEAAPAAAPAPATDPGTPAAPAAGGDHKEVSLDQDVFDATLADLLAKGTDRRVAEGQARRAAMIAARKKAAGG